MSASSDIEWTDATWNPVRGCQKVSPGCKNCYAMRQAHRFSGPGQAYEGLTVLRASGPEWTGDFREVADKLAEPLTWRKPRRIFVNSMSDLFGDGVPNEFIAAVFGVMAACPQHTFQILTKRPERMREWFSAFYPSDPQMRVNWCVNAATNAMGITAPSAWARPALQASWPLPNVWLGVSVEAQEYAEQRIPDLLNTPAAVHFLSLEPLLGAVDLTRLAVSPVCAVCGEQPYADALDATESCGCTVEGAEPLAWASIDWVIVGGESGKGARPMHPDWARGIRDEVTTAGVPFFFKQWGEFAYQESIPGIQPFSPGTHWPGVKNKVSVDITDPSVKGEHRWMVASPVGKKAAGRLLDGRTWDQMPRPRAAP